MPRTPLAEAPDFHKVVADLRRRGPLTQAFGAWLIEQRGYHRSTAGTPLPYNTRRNRGAQYIHDLLFRGDVSEFEIAKAIHKYHTDLATTGQRAAITPNYEYQPR